MSYEIVKKLISNNRSWKPLTAKGTVVHETADPEATDENEQAYFNNGYRGASAHAFVDYNSITQCIPWNEQSWHAGYTANTNFIGIELCHYDDVNKFNEVWKRAIWLFAWVHVNVIKQTNINTDTLMSHAEVSNKWHETDHLDPISYFAQFGKTVNDFRNEVQNEINNMIGKPQPTPQPQDNSTLVIQQKLRRLHIPDYEGKQIDCDNAMGDRTRSAIKKFEEIMGLTVDVGNWGNQCEIAYQQIISKPYCDIRNQSNKYAVRYIQFITGAKPIDGLWGDISNKCVYNWQSSQGLSADSKFGNQSWTKAIGV